MHDGSLATLEDVVRHYESGGVARADAQQGLAAEVALTDSGARPTLVAFLRDAVERGRPRNLRASHG